MSNNQELMFLTIENLDKMKQIANIYANSDLVPKDFKNKPNNVIVAISMGAELGLSPMQSLQSIAVVNGRPSIWGDGMLAIVQRSPLCEDIIEEFNEETMTATCTVKRKGQRPYTQKFDIQDADKAGLLNKPGAWQTSPKRMLQLRARSFALRNKFSDLLRGLQSAEEQYDIIDMRQKSEKDVYEPLTNDINDQIKHNESPKDNVLQIENKSLTISEHLEYPELEEFIQMNNLRPIISNRLDGKDYAQENIDKFEKFRNWVEKLAKECIKNES